MIGDGLFTMLLHDSQELDDDLGDGANENLTLAALLSIINALKSIVQHAYKDHLRMIKDACWCDSLRTYLV